MKRGKILEKELWISNEILEWQGMPECTHIFDKDKWERAYLILNHARKLIENNDSILHLSDGVLNLKRAMNQRLQLIEQYYKLKEHHFTGKKKGYLELLEQYGLARPYML